jgi:UrcA family protein
MFRDWAFDQYHNRSCVDLLCRQVADPSPVMRKHRKVATAGVWSVVAKLAAAGPYASADITGWPQKPKEAMMLRAFTAVSILVLTVTTANAYPYPPIEVTFGDLDLSRSSDANVLRERVQQAANTACGQLQFAYPSPPSLYYRVWFRDCVSATSAKTTRQIEARAGQYLNFASN